MNKFDVGMKNEFKRKPWVETNKLCDSTDWLNKYQQWGDDQL